MGEGRAGSSGAALFQYLVRNEFGHLPQAHLAGAGLAQMFGRVVLPLIAPVVEELRAISKKTGIPFS